MADPEGDFGYPRLRERSRNQVIAFIDLVGFTGLESNEALLQAFQDLGNAIKSAIRRYFWGDIDEPGCHERSTNNLLLISTGDGYAICFSQSVEDLDALNTITAIYEAITKRHRHRVRVGINKGENFVVKDLNDRVNIVGWGINLAQRALSVAQPNQVVLCELFADSLQRTYGIKGISPIGKLEVKGATYTFYNYYVRGRIGLRLVGK